MPDPQQVPVASNHDEAETAPDLPMFTLGTRICAELGAEDDDFHYFCGQRATMTWQNRLKESRLQTRKQESEHAKYQRILESTVGHEATSLFFEVQRPHADLPPLSYRRRTHAAGQYMLYSILGREDQLPTELLTYTHPVPGSNVYESLWDRPKDVRQLGVQVGYQHSASEVEAKSLKRVQDISAFPKKRRAMLKTARSLPSCKRVRNSSGKRRVQDRIWARWEDDLLVRSVCVYGNNWDLLCDILNQKLLRRSLSLRTPGECYDRCTMLDTLKLYPDCWELACDFGEALMKPNEPAPVFWDAERVRGIRVMTLPKLRAAANLPIFSSMQSAMTNIPAGPKLPGMNNRDAQFQNTHESHSNVGAPDGAKMPLSILTESLVNKKQREAEQQRSQTVSNTNNARWRGIPSPHRSHARQKPAVSSAKQMSRLPMQQQTSLGVAHAPRSNDRMVSRTYQAATMPRNIVKPSPPQQPTAILPQSLHKTI